MISVVVPVYLCADCLSELYDRLVATLAAIDEDYEIILVNDGSPDRGWSVIVELVDADARVRGVDLARNFGQHAAIAAGLEHCRGDWVVVMDADLQDRPEEVANLYRAACEGYDIVLARRGRRRHSLRRRLPSAAFYALLRCFTRIPQDRSVANFGIYRRPVIGAILATRQFYFFPLLVRSVSTSFKTRSLDVEHADRASGRSSYNLYRLVTLGIDIIASYRGRSVKRPLYVVRELYGVKTAADPTQSRRICAVAPV